jgi:hypothetical protein
MTRSKKERDSIKKYEEMKNEGPRRRSMLEFNKKNNNNVLKKSTELYAKYLTIRLTSSGRRSSHRPKRKGF